MKTRQEWLEIVKRDYHHLSEEAHEHLVDHIFATHPDHKIRLMEPEPDRVSTWLKKIFYAIIWLIVATLLAPHLHSQTATLVGAKKGASNAAGVTATPADANHTGLDMVCISGCAGSSGSTTPSNSFANPTTAGMAMSFNAMWNGTTWDLVKGDTTSGLWVNCKNGCAGGTSTPSNAFANPTTAGLSQNFNMMWNGTTWDLVKGDTTSGLWVNCKSGCAGGSSTPTDAFANPTTAGLSQGFTMMWNGTTWDRVKGDTTSGLWVNLKNASVAVTGTFWQATQPVSGTFWQATQPVSIASMPSTPVTGTFFQATQPVSNAGTFSVQCTSGCAGGASTPADTFANPTTAGLQMTFGMLWNGTSWDRWYGDKTNGAFVNVKNASLAVTGTFWQATQPVSGTFWQATQPVSIATMPSTPVTGTFWQATQPVSGTVAFSNSTIAVTNAGTFAVQPTGTLGDNGGAATTNRMGTLPAIALATPPAAKTTGRDSALLSDLHGVLYTSQMPTDVASYVASKQGLVSAASATDIAVLSGNASNTVIVTKIMVSCTQTTAGIIDLVLLKRSTADTAGTSTGSPTTVPLDSSNAAGSSAVLTYTANPTTGSLVGNVDVIKLGCMATGTTSPNDIYIWRPSMGQSIILRGTAQQIALNLNAATVTGGNFDITIQWIEATNY